MACVVCKDLERTLDFRRSKYFEARSAPYYQVSTELAAQKNVDMERAKNDLEGAPVCMACRRTQNVRRTPIRSWTIRRCPSKNPVQASQHQKALVDEKSRYTH